MRFSTIAGMPPFGNLHLKIIDKVLPLIEDGGSGCFIHPARWYEDPQATYKKNSDQVKFRTEREAKNFETSCCTNFYQNIVYLLKCDMHSPLKFLPWMEDYSNAWTDEDYCRFFGALGMSTECQRWMCREVYDYRVKDFIKDNHKYNS